MTKIIELNYCGECPHHGTDWDVDLACKLLDPERKTPIDDVIPSWCPLPDKVANP